MRFKKIFLVFLVTVLVSPSLLVAANPVMMAEDEEWDAAALEEGSFIHKDEVVYGTLHPNGDQEDIHVVNHFSVTEPGMLIDYGNYDSVRNLTDLSEIEQVNGEIHFSATEENFYYQGNLNHAALPWEFSISYFHDGEEINPANLLGADGHIEIIIETAQNEEGEQQFFENYLLQISLTADPDRFSNIEAEEATEASAGSDKQFTYTVMPEEEEILRFSADVTDFEMEAIDINAVPSTMSIDEPETDEMTEEMTSLTDAIGEINNGVGELRDGVSELNSGVIDLQNGSAQFRDGMTEINQSSSELVDGSSQINDALATMSQSLSAENIDFDLGELTRLPEGLGEMAEAVGEIADGLEELKENYQTAYEVFDKAMDEIPEYHIDEEEIIELYKGAGGESEALDQLIDIYEKALVAKGTYDEVKQGFQAIDPALNEIINGIRELETALNTTSKEISTAIDNMDVMDPITQLTEGLTEISNNYNAFHAGLVSYTDGVGELSGAYGDIHAGISELGEGTRELEGGTSELHDGTNELYASTNDLPDQIQEEIDEMIAEYDKSDFDPVSFTSSENESINSVQFVLRTESITADDDEEDEAEEEEEEKGIWERFLDLFR
ncbi:YhgE/Pip domain-containing protein [Virgibacillus kimchii]